MSKPTMDKLAPETLAYVSLKGLKEYALRRKLDIPHLHNYAARDRNILLRIILEKEGEL